MLLQFTKEQVINGLTQAAGIIPAKAGAAYLRSLWIKAENNTICLMATDANLEFTGVYPAEVSEPGLVGVNGRNFVDLVRRLPAGQLKLRLDATTGNLIIEQGRRNYKLPVSDASWFQPLATFPAENAVTWSGDFFQENLDKTLFCVSDDDSADALACFYMRPLTPEDGEQAPEKAANIEVCGLNGHQFARVRFIHDDLAARLPQEGVLLQKKYASEMRKWLGGDDIEINFTDKRVFLRTGDGQECISLPRANFLYPDTTAFMARLADPTASLLVLDRKECLDALDRINIFNTGNDRWTYFDLASTEVALSAQGQDTGSANEAFEATYDGEITRIAFPTKNMMDILTRFVSSTLRLTITSDIGPCGINGDDDPGYTVLLMPMQVAEQTYYSEES